MKNNKGQFEKGYTYRQPKPYWDREWLLLEYVEKNKPANQIAEEQGCTENNVLYFLNKHEIPRREMRVIRGNKHWGLVGVDNPMWNKKGELNPNWRGGITPERQSFYQSQEWKDACVEVWRRDKALCQRCGIKKGTDMPFHIHHIEGFASKELRAILSNLILLCEGCHQWVHSRKNVAHDFIQ